MKKGFTLVELMAVIAIIGVLMGIITTTVQGSMRQARLRKAQTAVAVVQQGIATFYAQKGYWPGSVGTKIKNSSLEVRSNNEGPNGQTDVNKFVLNDSEVDDMITDIIKENKKGNAMMDVSGLYVTTKSGGTKNRGMDFKDAIMGTKRHPKKMTVAQMHFGYPEVNNGYFRSFKVVYSIPTDEMKVSQ